MPGGASRRYFVLFVAVSAFFCFFFVWTFRNQQEGARHPNNENRVVPVHHVDLQDATLTGGTIMPHLGNATVKAELGRASWKLFHTIFARFPDHPTPDESTALQAYIHLFARLYPCGECATHFRKLLDQFPPQVSSRSTAAAWGCHVHNEVNKRLHKELFDCSKIGDFYDCGCEDDGSKPAGETKGADHFPPAKPEMSQESKEKLTGDVGRDLDVDLLKPAKPLELEKEGLTRGG